MLNRFLRRSRGFTLVETLIAVSIMTMMLGLVGGGIFQSLSIERFWLDDVVATREVRHAESWFAGDAMNAEEVCAAGAELAPGATSISSVLLVRYEIIGSGALPLGLCTLVVDTTQYDLFTTTYTLTGTFLTRTTEKNAVGSSQQTITLSKRISGAEFTRSAAGDLITVQLDVNAERGATESSSLAIFLRRLR
ncbi:MAG: prepilin-type N-terminal cleavage/methylation domain-containing protein [Chloroflexi bacterium]|nr:prepilin-type N-terminal cleavage/methylation domain-containing protein [Chloroflexota bacterium]